MQNPRSLMVKGVARFAFVEPHDRFLRGFCGGAVPALPARMESAELLARAERFALRSLGFYRTLSKTPEAQVPGVQFYKAATSAWMNYRSSKRGKSRPDFISKLGTAVEEIDESVGWLEFMDKGRIAVDKALLAEASELCAIFTTSLQTARANWEAQQAARRRKKRTRSVLVKFPDPSCNF